MLIAVRHGSTSFNGEGEKLRGWLNLHLSEKGQTEAVNAAKNVNHLIKGHPINSFHSSDLLRAMQTASKIQDKVHVPFKKTNQLRDWNIGDFSGKPVKGNIEKLHKFIENPDEKVPGGESYDSFYERVSPLLRQLVEDDGNHIAVTHNRLTTLLRAMAKNKGESPDIKTLKQKGPIEPGGVMVIQPDWSFHTLE